MSIGAVETSSHPKIAWASATQGCHLVLGDWLALHGRPEGLDESVVEAGDEPVHGCEQAAGERAAPKNVGRALRASIVSGRGSTGLVQ